MTIRNFESTYVNLCYEDYNTRLRAFQYIRVSLMIFQTIQILAIWAKTYCTTYCCRRISFKFYKDPAKLNFVGQKFYTECAYCWHPSTINYVLL